MKIQALAALVDGLQAREQIPQIEFIAGDAAIALTVRHLVPLGEADRAALAAGFLAAPELLIVDEPSSSVDDGLAEVMWSALGAYPREMVPGAAVLVITSDIGLMSHSGIVDSVVMLRDGRVIADDEAAAVLGSDDPYISRFLGAYLGR